MPKRIILLSGDVEAAHLTDVLRQHNPDLDVTPIFDKNALVSVFNSDLAGTRLIAFLTSVIVPAEMLSALQGPAYNFHPGPPEYPGSYVAGFAIYDGAETFGVTLHEMAPRVDSGPIVEVRRFAVPSGAKFQDLEMSAFQNILQMFTDHAPHMASDDTPLPSGVEPWTGQFRTCAEAERLKEIESDLSEDEIVRRYRAFG